MKTENDKELDNLFKHGLDHHTDPPYREEDWIALEQLLDKRSKKRAVMYWLPVLAGIAALLLIYLGWGALRPRMENRPKKMSAVTQHKNKNTGTSGGSIQLPRSFDQEQAAAGDYSRVPKSGEPGHKKERYSSPAVGDRRDTTGPGATIAELRRPTAGLAAISGVDINFTPAFKDEILAGQLVVDSAYPLQGEELKPKRINVEKTHASFRPQLALSVLAASDLNGVNSFQQGKLGTNLGLLLSATVFKKLIITTGAIYSVKPYITGFQNYHTPYQFKTDPINVTADCRMLDVPVNIGYQVFHKAQNKLSVGTGLSSYIMLHENYTFNYANPYASGPSQYTVPNSNKYLLGVLNLNATYERQLNSKVGLSIQPYVKLPLTNIGASQVKLQTAGVAIGFSWNLNSLTKP